VLVDGDGLAELPGTATLDPKLERTGSWNLEKGLAVRVVKDQDFALLPLVWVALVFGIGQVLESMWLTPVLVGDKIGLHPVAVIFALMAGGQLFGFVGILIALPGSAVIAVLLRHFKQEWLKSPLYSVGAPPPPAAEPAAEPAPAPSDTSPPPA